jgi:DNA polymerase I-like protein with 3'-5' exonuclease and polymerase domains
MRSDAVGIFWQDIPRKGKDRMARVMPPIPDTGWQRPTEFPRLEAASALGLDTETKDPNLLTKGPGWARGDGHIVGIAVSVPEGPSWYFPMRHEVESDWNIEPDHVLAWARHELTRPHQPKIGANLTYDVGWLRQEGVHVRGMLYDVQFAESLLSESYTVNLDDVSERRLGIGKRGSLLYQWCADYYGGKPNDSQRANIHRAPPRIVGPYAEGDVELPFPVLDIQWRELAEQGLLNLFDMESRLIYLMIEMRYAGVSIDLEKVEQLHQLMIDDLREIDSDLQTMVGFEVNTNAAESMARAFDGFGIPYPRTEKTNKPSFRKGVLEKIDHPLVELILKKKAREKLKGTFLEGYLLNSHVNGKIYGSFNQLRGDSEGARSGRFSSSDPNLQNIPKRSKLGKQIRNCFVPDYGHDRWIKADYSQVEYRGLAHYAVGPGSDNVRHMYLTDPKTDFHKMVHGLIKAIAGLDLERELVKNVNFGTVYGMGEPGLARYMKLQLSKAKELLGAIHNAAPFLKTTMNATMEEAQRLGYITTILGRRSRFDLWVPGKYSEDAKPLPYERAILSYVNPQRAYLHKSLNRRLQGSAADLIKMAMLICWEMGLFAPNEAGVPRLTVHDELDWSATGGKEHVFNEVFRVMETAIPFSVPIMVGREIGKNWGEVDEFCPVCWAILVGDKEKRCPNGHD